ncbi:MAG TPA: ABC transporter substrate-binding protein [Gaiellaceae bacterium]|jgi:polar amino acid transport system substrate-binding protein|nr:ABC transporter substrate-binding protein [Gaiellaceae bacterium]
MQRLRLGRLSSCALVVAASVAAAGCGGSSSSSSSTTTTSTTASAAIVVPSNIKSAGKLVFCSDITYPPEESYKAGTTTAQGSDIDIGNYIAKKMAVKAQFDNTGFDGIIAALLAKKCDLIISGMNDTPQRRKQVFFVDYLKVGQSFMVRKGNPSNISTLASLAGKSASVETGTTNKDFLDALSKKLQGEGKKAINVVTFPKDTDAANALKTGRVDAYFGDSPVVAYYLLQDPQSFAIVGNPTVVNPIPIGIAIRKSDTQLQTAVAQAVKDMYSDGTINKILAKWKLGKAAAKLQQ